MLDWEEHVFVGLRSLYRLAFTRPAERRRAAVRAHLNGQRQELLFLAQLLAQRPVSILETREAALCGSDRVFLPEAFDVARTREANERLFHAKSILAALALRDRWNPAEPTPDALTRYRDEFPGLEPFLDSIRGDLPPETSLAALLGRPLADAASHGGTPGSDAPNAPESEPSSQAVTTEIDGHGQAEVEVVPGRDDDGNGADMPMHTFEKVETLEEYSGESRKTDGGDELEEHAEALDELRMRHVIRSPDRPSSIYRGDLILDGSGFDLLSQTPPEGIPYPEWDHRKQAYRKDWCHVQPAPTAPGVAGWGARTALAHRQGIDRLQRQFSRLISDWLRLRAQPYGRELDIDAVVRAETDRRTGHTPGESVYIEQQRDLHDVAAIVLIDGSYSTDAWLDNRRVADVIAETVLCTGQVLDRHVERFAIATFSSNTRRSCRFEMLKDFREPWATSRDRLGGINPAGYTRIGPALRHAHELLHRQNASRRLVILLTDGRPCDYDRYEGDYGIRDVRKAIETGKRHGLMTHAFAIEKHAASYFPRMFTQHHYDILPNPTRLAPALCGLFARVLAR